jgi:hypothetical protein
MGQWPRGKILIEKKTEAVLINTAEMHQSFGEKFAYINSNHCWPFLNIKVEEQM